MRPEILLKAYVLHKSDDAFRELVISCLDQVYSRAMEISDNTTPLAEEITLQVFWELARKSASLREETVVADWLEQQTLRIGTRVLRDAGRTVHRSANRNDPRPTPQSTSQSAPRGLVTGITQGVLLNMARRRSWFALPRAPQLPRLPRIKPLYTRIALTGTLVLLLLWHLPLHRRNPIVPDRKNLKLSPASFAQLGTPEEGEAPSIQKAPIETLSNQP